ncbi:nucleoside recognition domain-containing protein [Ignavibacteria bacterium]
MRTKRKEKDSAQQTGDKINDGGKQTAAQRKKSLLEKARQHRKAIGENLHDAVVAEQYGAVSAAVERSTSTKQKSQTLAWQTRLDRIVTGRISGFLFMFVLFTIVFWITISGANIPSAALSLVLIGKAVPLLHAGAAAILLPPLAASFLIDGVYLATAWVISVMLPPMAIFFPLFTILEDFGYLPRVAFNLDNFFKKAGAHGKQSLSMMMGFGCNAAGVVATRIIDSPRERLIAIITNNFSLCNGRWPTQILIATLFIGPLVPSYFGGIISAGAVVAVAILGVAISFAASWGLSRTILKGEISTFSMELPPYRRPKILRTLYTSLIDRTLIVLWRAVVFAMPAGAVIWLVANITLGGTSIAEITASWLNPIGLALGLNGIILLAYIIAIPANEIIIPTILMLTVQSARIAGAGSGAGVLFDIESASYTLTILQAGGWTLLTGINLMLFSLLHHPCGTTIYTIYKETGSLRWTMLATLLPIGIGFTVTFTVARIWALFFR